MRFAHDAERPLRIEDVVVAGELAPPSTQAVNFLTACAHIALLALTFAHSEWLSHIANDLTFLFCYNEAETEEIIVIKHNKMRRESRDTVQKVCPCCKNSASGI